jgi:hypothetical protein
MTFLGGHSLEHQVYRFLDQRFAEPGARLQLSRHAGQSSFDNASR